MKILCVHGVGHKEKDIGSKDDFTVAWKNAVIKSLGTWGVAEKKLQFEFLHYDQLFEEAGIGPDDYAVGAVELLTSGVVHTAEDWINTVAGWFGGKRDLADIPDTVRWTAGMVAQWAADEELRDKLVKNLYDHMDGCDIVLAHSLGTLFCYDAFLRKPEVLEDKYFVSFGSQIGNPAVRGVYHGYLLDIKPAKRWFHLYNPYDHVLTAPLDDHIRAENFIQVNAQFDSKGLLNHDAERYLTHPQTVNTAWREMAGQGENVLKTRALKALSDVATRRTPTPLPGAAPSTNRKALLIGINDYPDPQNRLEGCVNDVFLMSSVLQECGFAPEDIRVVLDSRATASGIMDRLHWLLDGTQPGDERVLFYSGHGAQIPALNPLDEPDHLDECLVPYDFDWSRERAITDKQFNELYSQLPYDCYFVAIFDCCHSGGMTRAGSRTRGLVPPDDIRHRAVRWDADKAMWIPRNFAARERNLTNGIVVGDTLHRLGHAQAMRIPDKNAHKKALETYGHHGPYLPVLMQACREDQLASEYRHGVTSYGAYTYCLAQTLRSLRNDKKNPDFLTLSGKVACTLSELGFDQVPNLVGPKVVLGSKVPWVK
ncbi:MAG: caspase family protein [Sulfuricella sp.]|nr:caspase family protein [Sulfuricella sp.]